MTAEQARAEVFGDIAQVQGGYDQRCEPVTGRAFWAFVGIAIKREGEPALPGGVKRSADEAMRVHVEALSAWLKVAMGQQKRPVVCVRAYPSLESSEDGEWIAVTRLLVTEGDRDVEAKKDAANEERLRKRFEEIDRHNAYPYAPVRGVVVADQPVVGVAQ